MAVMIGLRYSAHAFLALLSRNKKPPFGGFLFLAEAVEIISHLWEIIPFLIFT